MLHTSTIGWESGTSSRSVNFGGFSFSSELYTAM